MCVGSPDVAEQGKVKLGGGRLGRGQRCTEDGVGTQPGLVGCAVGIDHGEVDGTLVERIGTIENLCDLPVDVLDRPEDPFARKPGSVVP